MAPCSLISTVDRHPTCSARLPRPSGSTLVRQCPDFAMAFQASVYASTLHPFSSTGLHLPSSSTVVLSLSSFTGLPDLASVPRAISSALALKTSGITLTLCILSFAWVSTSVSQNPGSILVLPSIISAMGLHLGSCLALSVVLAFINSSTALSLIVLPQCLRLSLLGPLELH